MNNQAFHFEIHDLCMQFMAAFDGCIIKRYKENTRTVRDQIAVRYVIAPKHRVIYDLVNKGQNITLPVVAASISQVRRDPSRVSNAISGFTLPRERDLRSNSYSRNVPTPVPINIGINMSIVTKYQKDLDQIISNFAAYTNPYIVITYQIPAEFGLSDVYEIRSEVEWSGDITINRPDILTDKDDDICIADTSFTIKGWLFQEAPTENINNIFFVHNNFFNANSLSGNPTNRVYTKYEDYTSIEELDYTGNIETVSVSAAPSITNVYYDFNGLMSQHLSGGTTLNRATSGGNVVLLGKRFGYTTLLGLSSDTNTTSLTSVTYPYYGEVSFTPITAYTIINDNTITLRMPEMTVEGRYALIVLNAAGFDVTYNVNDIEITMSTGIYDNVLALDDLDIFLGMGSDTILALQ